MGAPLNKYGFDIILLLTDFDDIKGIRGFFI